MTSLTLDQLIETETAFITDIEEIIDVLDDVKQVQLYDTSAISSHELALKNHQILTFYTHTQGVPILITDTIAKEMRLEGTCHSPEIDRFCRKIMTGI